MVSGPNTAPRMLSPRPNLGPGLRGVTKHATSSRFGATKTKKAQRALCTVFEESALASSSPLFVFKAARLQSPGGRPARRNFVLHPSLGRLRMQELRDAPSVRKATPIKERPLTLRTFGRHRIQSDLDALADELGTCQLQSALKGVPPAHHAPTHGQASGALELQPLALMLDDGH